MLLKEKNGTVKSFSYLEDLFIDAYVGDAKTTRDVLKQAGLDVSLEWCKNMEKKEHVRKAIAARGPNPFVTRVLLSKDAVLGMIDNEIMACKARGAVNLAERQHLKSLLELRARTLGAFTDNHNIKIEGHEDWLRMINESRGKKKEEKDSEL